MSFLLSEETKEKDIARDILKRLLIYYERSTPPPKYLARLPAWISFRRVVPIMGSDCEYVLAICNAIRIHHPDVVERILSE